MDAMWSPGEAVLDELPELTVEEELDRFEDECSRGNAPPSGSVLGKGRRNGSAKRRNKKKYAAAAVTCVGGFGRGMLSEYFRKQAQIPPPGVEIVGKTPSSSIPAGAEPEDPEEVNYRGETWYVSQVATPTQDERRMETAPTEVGATSTAEAAGVGENRIMTPLQVDDVSPATTPPVNEADTSVEPHDLVTETGRPMDVERRVVSTGTETAMARFVTVPTARDQGPAQAAPVAQVLPEAGARVGGTVAARLGNPMTPAVLVPCGHCSWTEAVHLKALYDPEAGICVRAVVCKRCRTMQPVRITAEVIAEIMSNH